MRKGGGGGDRRQQHVKILKELAPDETQFHPRLVGRAPGAMVQRGAARHGGAGALVAGLQRRPNLQLRGEILVTHARCRGCAQQRHKQFLMLCIVRNRPRGFVHRGAGAPQRRDGGIEARDDAGVELAERRTRPHRHAKIAEPATARFGQRHPPCRLVHQIRSGENPQRQVQIRGVPRHRADN